jgi:hypothetical protein
MKRLVLTAFAILAPTAVLAADSADLARLIALQKAEVKLMEDKIAALDQRITDLEAAAASLETGKLSQSVWNDFKASGCQCPLNR